MGAVRFPRRGAEVPVPVFDAPSLVDGETPEAFATRVADYDLRREIVAVVRLVSREQARGWGLKYQAASARDQKRRRELERADEMVPDITPEGVAEMMGIWRDILAACLVRIEGVVVGELLLATITDITELIQLLDDCDLLPHVANAATKAQQPSPKQGESCGSR